MIEITKTYVSNDVAAELGLKGTKQEVQGNVLNGHSEILEAMPVEISLELLDDNVNIKINTFLADFVT